MGGRRGIWIWKGEVGLMTKEELGMHERCGGWEKELVEVRDGKKDRM